MGAKEEISGYFVEENGQRYFVHGNTRIKVVEHFNPNGSTLREIMLKLFWKRLEKGLL